MTITLETVRQTMRAGFGRDSFIGSYISRIEESQDCATASIDARGVLRYKPDFVNDFVKTPEDLFCLIAHELLS